MEFYWKKKRKKKELRKEIVSIYGFQHVFWWLMCTMQVFSLYLPDPVRYLISIVCVLLVCPWTWT
jgi:hypothetical protein